MKTPTAPAKVMLTAAICALLGLSQPSHAVTGTWDTANYSGAGSTIGSAYNWFGTASPPYWLDNTVPNGIDDVANFFPGNFIDHIAVNIGTTNLTLGSLGYRDSDVVNRALYLYSSGGTYTFATTSGTPDITAYTIRIQVNAALHGTQGMC